MIRLTTIKINQTIVHFNGTSTFFSYDTPICTKESDGSVTLHEAWDYSSTTSKYRSQFLNGETTVETRRKLLKGIYPIKSYYG